MPIQNIKKGDLLLAKPTLSNDIFNRSVVLITEHNLNGSVGFIVNKPSHIPLSIFVSQIESDSIVFEGGPVDKENIYYIHKRPDLIDHSEWITEDIYWSGDYDDVKKAINENLIDESEIRFYLGYSGWEKNQLDQEYMNNAWVRSNSDIDIFDFWEVDLWRKLMKKLGGEHLLWLNTPADPSMN